MRILQPQHVQKTITSLAPELGKANTERLIKLLTCFETNDKIQLSNALKTLFPDLDIKPAQTRFRNFRVAVNQAAQDLNIVLSCVVDTRKRTPVEERWCWFEGEPMYDDVLAHSQAETGSTDKALSIPQDAIIPGNRLIRYFVSFSHEDEALVNDLMGHLQHNFKASKRYRYQGWRDSMILLGGDWHADIQSNLATCDFGLLFVSLPFLNSDYVQQYELSQFVSQEPPYVTSKKAIPVGLNVVDFEHHDLRGLDKLQIFQHEQKFYAKSRVKEAFATALFRQIEQAMAVYFQPQPKPETMDEKAKRLLPVLSTSLLDCQGKPMNLNDHHSIDAKKNSRERVNAVTFLYDWAVADNAPPFCALLGDYGLGKTTTCHLLTQRLLAERAHNRALPLPIYVDLRGYTASDYPGPIRLDNILQSCLASNWKGGALSENIQPSEVIALARQQRALVLFDGLDEVVVHLGQKQAQNFIRELWRVLPPSVFQAKNPPDDNTTGQFGKLLISCRSHYFRSLWEQETMLTGENREGIKTKDYQACLLLPFTEAQIREYLEKNLDALTVESALQTIAFVHNLTELAQRPYTLSLIAAFLPELEALKMRSEAINAADLYDIMVNQWLHRDQGKHQFNPTHKRLLMEQLAAALWRAGQKRWPHNKVEAWLDDYLHRHAVLREAYQTKEREILKEDLRTATFITRADESYFGFAHTSLQEYFLACYLCNGLREKQPETWDLPMPSAETVAFLGQLLQKEPDVDICLDTLSELLKRYHPQRSELAFRYWLVAQQQGYPCRQTSIDLQGAQLTDWVIGSEDKAINLRGVNFSGAQLDKAVFRRVDLSFVTMTGAYLWLAEFHQVVCTSGQWAGANLTGSVWRYCTLEKNDFQAAQCRKSQWVGCRLQLNDGMGAQPGMLFVDCTNAPYPLPPVTSEDVMLYVGHSSFLTDCAFSPDGLTLASASNDGMIQLWDVETGQQRLELSGHSGAVSACVFSPDGLTLASASDDQTVRLWDANSGVQRLELVGHSGGVTACVFSPDGLTLASASHDETVRLWDVNSGAQGLELVGHSNAVSACAFNPDGLTLASASHDQTVRIWDVNSGAQGLELVGHSGAVTACVFSSDGLILASASHDLTVRLWDVNSGAQGLELAGHSDAVTACVFSPDGLTLTSASYDGTVRLWDSSSGAQRLELSGHSGVVSACVFSPDGLTLASASYDQAVRLWDSTSGAQRLELSGHLGWVTACVFSPDGLTVASSSSFDQMVCLWDSNSGAQRLELSGHSNAVRACAFSPDGLTLASASSDKTVRLWDVNSGEQKLALSGHSGAVSACVFSPDGLTLASASDDQTVRLWDSSSGAQRLELVGHSYWVTACAFSPDGLTLASASGDKTVRLWDSNSGVQKRELSGHSGAVIACAFSPDGLTLASASSDQTVRFWDSHSGAQKQVLSGHLSAVNTCVFSPDGLTLASASYDQTVRLWSASSGECKLSIPHPRGVTSCAFSPDGQHLLTGCEDSAMRLWDIHGHLVAVYCHLPKHNSAAWRMPSNKITWLSEAAWRWVGWRVTEADTGAVKRWPITSEVK